MCILKLLEMKQLFRTDKSKYIPWKPQTAQRCLPFFSKALKLLVQHSRNWWLPWVWKKKTPCPQKFGPAADGHRVLQRWAIATQHSWQSLARLSRSQQPLLGFSLPFPSFPRGTGSTGGLERDDRDVQKLEGESEVSGISNEDRSNICPQPEMYSPAQTHSSDEALKYLLPKYQSS